MAIITLVRHGQTNLNKNQIIQGRQDVPLNNLGKLQAKDAGLNLLCKNVQLIVSSPLIRAIETAEIIAKIINYDDAIILSDAFIERDFGIADGKRIEDYVHNVFEQTIEGLETEEAIKHRALEGLKEICTYYTEEHILIVCHSHTIKAILTAIDPNRYDFKYKLDNGSAITIEYKDHVFMLK